MWRVLWALPLPISFWRMGIFAAREMIDLFLYREKGLSSSKTLSVLKNSFPPPDSALRYNPRASSKRYIFLCLYSSGRFAQKIFDAGERNACSLLHGGCNTRGCRSLCVHGNRTFRFRSFPVCEDTLDGGSWPGPGAVGALLWFGHRRGGPGRVLSWEATARSPPVLRRPDRIPPWPPPFSGSEPETRMSSKKSPNRVRTPGFCAVRSRH